jgi:hypothetical protein
MNEQLRRAFEAAQQLSDIDQCAVAACILWRIREIKGIEEQEPEAIMEQSRPLTGREFMEQLYRDGTILNIPTWEPLTEEEEAERARLAQVFVGGKPLSEIVIEGRGPY